MGSRITDSHGALDGFFTPLTQVEDALVFCFDANGRASMGGDAVAASVAVLLFLVF